MADQDDSRKEEMPPESGGAPKPRRRSRHRVWKMLCRAFRRKLLRPLMVLFCLLALADFWLEWQGIPSCLCDILQDMLRQKGKNVQFDRLQCGIFRGIILGEVRFKETIPGGIVAFRAERVSVEIALPELLDLSFFPSAVSMRNGYVSLLTAEGETGLDLGGIGLNAYVDGDGTLVVHSLGKAHGLPVNLDMRLEEARSTILKWLSEEHPMDDKDGALAEKLADVSRLLEKLVIPSGTGSGLTLGIRGPLNDLRRWKVSGYFMLQDALWDDMDVPRCICSISGNVHVLTVKDLRLWLGRTDGFSANAELYPMNGEFKANIRGSLTGDTVDYLLHTLSDGRESGNDGFSMKMLPWNTMNFRIAIERSPIGLKGLEARMVCELPDGNYGALGKGDGSLDISMAGGVLKLERARFTLSELWEEYVDISAELNLNTGIVSGKATSNLSLRHHLSEWDVDLPPRFVELSDKDCTLDITLEPSPLNLERLALHGTVSQEEIRVLGLNCRRLTIPFNYAAGRLEAKGISLADSDGAHDLCTLDVKLDIMECIKSGRMDVNMPRIQLNAFSKDANAWQTALDSHGDISLTSSGSRLAVSVEGTMDPAAFYRQYLRPLNLDPSQMLAHIDCADGERAHFALRLPEMALNGADDWRLDGRLAFGKSSFNGLQFRSAVCDDFSVGRAQCSFRGIHAVTEQGDDVVFDLHVTYSPLEMVFANARINGRPEVIGEFFVNRELHDIYARVFKDIHWSSEKRPHIQMPRLVFSSGEQWKVKCGGIYLNAEDVRYKNLQLDEANMIVTLDLPSGVTVEPAYFRVGDWGIQGKVDLTLLGTGQCRFQIYPTLLGADLFYVLNGLMPDVAGKLDGLAISKDCIISASGNLFLNGDARLNVSGTLETNQLTYGDVSLEKVNMAWAYDNGRLDWDVMDAGLFGGKLKCSGYYDLDMNQGDQLIIASDMSFDQVYGKLAAHDAERPAMKGKLSGELRLAMLNNWAGRPLHLAGDGHLQLTEGELWAVPVISKLGNVLKAASFGSSGKGLGQITEMEADVELNGVSVTVPRLRTNGTIVSLSGKGGFRWKDDWRDGLLNFRVNVIPVQDVKLLSLLLSSLTGMFQADLSGTLKENAWTLHTFFQDLL